MICKYCKLMLHTYDHRCSGCRSRMIYSARPSQIHAAKMIAYLSHTTRIDRTTILDEYKDWLAQLGEDGE